MKIASNAVDYTGAKGFRRIDYLKITIFGFALGALWHTLHTIILPLRVLDFVAGSEKTLWLGLLTFIGLILAMAVQPIAGTISDRSGFSWGRRRPYILLGTIAAILLLPGIGYFGSYAAVFLIYCLLQVSTNTAQGPFQAFIPDLVPEGKRGLASGVKSLLEIVGGIALVRLIGYFMGQYSTSDGSFWLSLVLGALQLCLFFVWDWAILFFPLMVAAAFVLPSQRTPQERAFPLTIAMAAWLMIILMKKMFLIVIVIFL